VRYVILFVFVLMATCAWGGDYCWDDADCDDGNECTLDACRYRYSCLDQTSDWYCVYSDVDDGTRCHFDGEPGVCKTGECRPKEAAAGFGSDGGI
jgi:hypothetical protein